ncbi:MAG: glycoside hydrolase family 172 protein [Terriglobia bacterium]
MKKLILFILILSLAAGIHALTDEKNAGFNGLNLNLGNLWRLSRAQTRSLSAENFKGEKGLGGSASEGTGARAARDLGRGWKISPSIDISAKQTFTLAAIDGSGAIQHIWMTPSGHWRHLILRFYWDGETTPSVEVPAGDFFACGLGQYGQVSSLPVCVNPGSGLNSYWQMPFRKSCKITFENLSDDKVTLYYQIDYTVTEVPEDAAYFHAQFRRSNPVPDKKDHVILDGVKGWGQYVGTAMVWGSHNSGWWGEGEIKFFMDGDKEFPTICGTGTEDYFGGSYDFENPYTRRYQEFTTPYSGMVRATKPDGLYDSQQRFSLYRWHLMDPVRFQKDLKVTIQSLGWHRSGGRYLHLQDDIASVGYWYQMEPHAPFPSLPDKDGLELN